MMDMKWILFSVLLPICYSTQELYVQNLTCSTSYPVQLKSITTECDDYCTLGTTANFATWLSYSGIAMSSTKIKVNVNFIPSVNLTLASQYNFGYVNVGFMSYDTQFSEVVDVCQDGYSCTNQGQFFFGFQYQLPNFGSLNAIIDSYQLQFDLSSYDSDTGYNKIANCQAFLSSENSTIRSTVYASSSSNHYLFYATALFLGTFAALSMKKKQENKGDKEIDDIAHDAFHQMSTDYETRKKHVIPEKIFELKNYLSESATMFWEETHSWPKDRSNFTMPFTGTVMSASCTRSDDTFEDDASQFGELESGVMSGTTVSVTDEVTFEDDASQFGELESGVMSGTTVSVTDEVDITTSSVSHQLLENEVCESATEEHDTIVASFDYIPAKEMVTTDENNFFVDDMKIFNSVEKQDTDVVGRTETQSTDDEEDEDDEDEDDEDHAKVNNNTENIKKQQSLSAKKNDPKPRFSSFRNIFKGSGNAQKKGFSKV